MKNNMKKVLSLLLAVLMMASLSVTAFAATGDFTGDTMEKNDIKAYYKVVHESDYTDISGVKLTWSVPVVKYTKTDTQTWDTSTLKWVKSNSEDTTGTGVTFTLANYGSYAVKAGVSFTPNVADSASVSFVKDSVDTNNPTLASIVNDDHSLKVTQGDMNDDDFATAKSGYITNNCTATISGTVSLDDASQLTAASGKLGTYTVSIRNTKHTVTVNYKTEGGVNAQSVFTVADGTAIRANQSVLTVGDEQVTTVANYNDGAYAFSKWEDNDGAAITSGSVTQDLTVTATYVE